MSEWSDDALAIAYLRGRGYKLTSRWNWLIPKDKEVSKEENIAAGYLASFDEWPWGWFTRSLFEGEIILG